MIINLIFSILLVVLGAVVWAWRGWSEPKLSNYVRALIASLIIVSAFLINYCPSILITINSLGAVLILTVLEAILGYGDVTSELNNNNISTSASWEGAVDVPRDWIEGTFINPINPIHKELWTYLALISLCYSLLTFLVLFPGLPSVCYLTVAIIGAIGFPLGKFADIYIQNNLTNEKSFVYTIDKFIIDKLHILRGLDSWKVAEGIIGAFIVLSWKAGLIVLQIFF